MTSRRRRSSALTPERVTRYSRHIIMAPGRQRRVSARSSTPRCSSSAPAASARRLPLYLALAGIGTIGIVDFDVVDLSNLQRQILHQNDDIGKPKAQSAKETLNAYNPDVEGDHARGAAHVRERDGASSSQYDIIINGADNFAVRYLVNDACYLPQEAPGRRLDPAVRRPGDRLPARPGLLPLPLPVAASARHGAILRRSRRARRPLRHRRLDPGDRSA